VTKSELIAKLSMKNKDLQPEDLEKVVVTIFDEISSALADGRRVELRGFGAFSVRDRAARTGRNPRTGDSVEVPSKRVPFFKMGKDLKERIND